MCWPPLIDSVEPVMNPPSSSTRKATPRAIFLRLAEATNRNLGDDLAEHVFGTAATMSCRYSPGQLR